MAGCGCVTRARPSWSATTRPGGPTDEVTLPLPGGGEGRAIACAVSPDGATLWVVGIEALAPGVELFSAMPAGQTVGHLWRADLTR